MSQTNSMYFDWTQQALKLTVGEELYIQAETRDEMKVMYSAFVKELLVMRQLMPVEASSIVVMKLFKDARHWVCLKRVASNPHIGFVKRRDGKIERVQIQEERLARLRRLELMVKDGLSKEDIEILEGPLSEEEVKRLWS